MLNLKVENPKCADSFLLYAADQQAQILIIGSGHSGLMLGVRLKMLGVDALIIE